jgi:hypothetical protein
MASQTWTEYFEDKLLPAGTFGKGPDKEKNLRNARCIMLLFYLGYGGAFLYVIYTLLTSGRIEVYTSSYKMDVIEAPSVAVCPFNPGVDVIPAPGVPEEDMIKVVKYGVDGPEYLKTKSYKCDYDRGCMCVNLWSVKDGPVNFQDYRQKDVEGIGTTGEKTDRQMTFRERIEVSTNVTDPSKDKTLKVGFYDSVDKAPQWFYMSQGVWVLGSLELQTWTVSDMSFDAIWHTMKGDLESMMTSRHLFRYTSQEVGDRGGTTESFVSYEMKNFFVDDTVSSETAFSPFALLSLVVMIMVRSAVIQLFTSTMFPEYDPKKGELVIRENSSTADSVTNWCGCFCFLPIRGGKSDERTPLMA